MAKLTREDFIASLKEMTILEIKDQQQLLLI